MKPQNKDSPTLHVHLTTDFLRIWRIESLSFTLFLVVWKPYFLFPVRTQRSWKLFQQLIESKKSKHLNLANKDINKDYDMNKDRIFISESRCPPDNQAIRSMNTKKLIGICWHKKTGVAEIILTHLEICRKRKEDKHTNKYSTILLTQNSIITISRRDFSLTTTYRYQLKGFSQIHTSKLNSSKNDVLDQQYLQTAKFPKRTQL